MDPFDEWVIKSEHKSVQKWSSHLVELGVTWDSFARNPNDVVNDLVTGGIPLFAARDIAQAALDAVKHQQSPMAIFWDLEHMPFPENTGRAVASKLGSLLSSQGDLVLFRGYADIGSGSIPQRNRSDLHSSGCMLVDCVNSNGIKEVIIIDAMQFAFSNMDGATLCFVTGDEDYAYLLSVLQRPQWRTIVVTKGAVKPPSFLNCGMTMSWERDILEKLPAVSAPPGFEHVAKLPLNEGGASQRSLGVQPQSGPQPLSGTQPLGNVTGNRGLQPKDSADVEDSHGFTETSQIEGPIISVSDRAPMPFADVPSKVIDLTTAMPFVLFVPWRFCPQKNAFPKKVFVQSTSKWAVLMFRELKEAERVVSDLPWLRVGTLVDWRQSGAPLQQRAKSTPSLPADVPSFVCSRCHDKLPITEMVPEEDNFDLPYCVKCCEWSIEDRNEAVSKVLGMMQMMAVNDEIAVAQSLLRNQLCATGLPQFRTRKLSTFWIEETVKLQKVISMKRPGSKTKSCCLPALYLQASSPYPPEHMDTSREEAHVLHLLSQRSRRTMPRAEIIESLKRQFTTMKKPFFRAKVFVNAHAKGLFFVAKGPFGQVVGLTKEDAERDLVDESDSTSTPSDPTAVNTDSLSSNSPEPSEPVRKDDSSSGSTVVDEYDFATFAKRS